VKKSADIAVRSCLYVRNVHCAHTPNVDSCMTLQTRARAGTRRVTVHERKEYVPAGMVREGTGRLLWRCNVKEVRME